MEFIFIDISILIKILMKKNSKLDLELIGSSLGFEGELIWTGLDCKIIVSAQVPVPFPWTLDLGFGTWIRPWILDLDFGLD